jgi:very-short-patch-repair endonuclease
VAGKQHGVVSVSQLGALGYSEVAIRHAREAGRLHPVHRGVYAVGHACLPLHGECQAAILACGAEALVSHRSAAWIWGLTQRFARPIEVTASSPRRTREQIRVHSAAALASEDRSRTEGIPVTSIARTLLDFAAADPGYLSKAVGNAYRLGLLDLISIDELLSRSKGFRGAARLRDSTRAYRGSAFTRSDLERYFLDRSRRGEFPQPSMNFFAGGYELDAYWPNERFAVELDTYEYHGDPTVFERDRRRQEDLKLAGIEMVRITGLRFEREPRAVARRIRRLLKQRRRQLDPQPG